MPNDGKFARIDWLFSMVRIAGAAFPYSASLLQLQAELDNKALSNRLKRLEDPISSLHDDIPKVAKLIYASLREQNTFNLAFDREFYSKYQRPLAMLESQRFIQGQNAIGNRYAGGLTISDPSFVLYLCVLAESETKMSSLTATVDSCEPGEWISGDQLSLDLGLPKPVVKAVFLIYESKGFGQVSREFGVINYVGRA